MTQPAEFSFDDNPDFVAAYDKGPPLFIPGYASSHFMAATVLADRIKRDADILVIGAGGGVEISAFARWEPGWRFVAVDPARSMLDLVRARIERDNSGTRVECVEGLSTDAPAGLFDAATAFLCLNFAPDDGTRLTQLRAIHDRLKPGAPFLMIHPATQTATRERDLHRYVRHAELAGAEAEVIERAQAMLTEHLHILTSTREEELLREAGFHVDGLFFKGLWVHGWEATA